MTDIPRRDHLLIAGTGRAGTSFLVRYLTGIGMDTNLARGGVAAHWDEDANAGFEDMPLINPTMLPDVIKAPWSFEFIQELLAHPAIRLRAAILPVRDLRDGASSRAIIERRAIYAHTDWMAAHDTLWEKWGFTPGGIVFSLNAIDQARLLAVGFHHVVQQLVAAEVPLLMLSFPRLVEDADYLFNALRSVLPPETTIEAARKVHEEMADLSKVRVSTTTEVRTSIRGPSEEELDRQALRRELVRVRNELRTTKEAMRSTEAELRHLQQEIAKHPAPPPIVVAQAPNTLAGLFARFRGAFLP